MIDAICILAILSLFAGVIYSTLIHPLKEIVKDAAAEVAPNPPSPVWLACSLPSCRMMARAVSAEEYARISRANEPVYCDRCLETIEAYRQQGKQ